MFFQYAPRQWLDKISFHYS